MSQRQVLKILREFAARERREKGGEVRIYQLKLATVLRRGPIPEMRIRSRGGACYLVELRQSKQTRIYFFDGNGQMLGAENYGPEDPELQRLLDHYRRHPG